MKKSSEKMKAAIQNVCQSLMSMDTGQLRKKINDHAEGDIAKILIETGALKYQESWPNEYLWTELQLSSTEKRLRYSHIDDFARKNRKLMHRLLEVNKRRLATGGHSISVVSESYKIAKTSISYGTRLNAISDKQKDFKSKDIRPIEYKRLRNLSADDYILHMAA